LNRFRQSSILLYFTAVKYVVKCSELRNKTKQKTVLGEEMKSMEE